MAYNRRSFGLVNVCGQVWGIPKLARLVFQIVLGASKT
jgi:hypothetical protein